LKASFVGGEHKANTTVGSAFVKKCRQFAFKYIVIVWKIIFILHEKYKQMKAAISKTKCHALDWLHRKQSLFYWYHHQKDVNVYIYIKYKKG